MIEAQAVESKQGLFSRLRRAPGSGVTELRFGDAEHPHAVCFDGVCWSLHRLEPGKHDTRELYAAGSLLELMRFLDTRWPLA